MNHPSHLLMVEPFQFGFNTDTAGSNSFQHTGGENVHQKALQEFQGFAGMLQINDIHVTVIPDTAEPGTPDSIFPNNWFSVLEQGTLVLFPMFGPNRRQERKQHAIDKIRSVCNITETYDLTPYEEKGLFLEGTGSMVLDRVNRVAYACWSPRTHRAPLLDFCERFGYSAETFSSTDLGGKDIYHTNVMMSMGDQFVIVCLESVKDEQEKANLIARFNKTGKDIIEISLQQVYSFAGNMLQVLSRTGISLLVMSTQAFQSLTTVQMIRLQKYAVLIHSPLDTIETVGGGSARCMMAELGTSC